MAAEAHRTFDLETGPLLRLTVVRLDHQDHLLLTNMHHIIADGWSNDLLLREVTSFYQSHVAGAPANLPPLPCQYGDFSAWQRQSLAEEQGDTSLQFWKRELAGIPALAKLEQVLPSRLRRRRTPRDRAHGLGALGTATHPPTVEVVTKLPGRARGRHRPFEPAGSVGPRDRDPRAVDAHT